MLPNSVRDDFGTTPSPLDNCRWQIFGLGQPMSWPGSRGFLKSSHLAVQLPTFPSLWQQCEISWSLQG